MAWKRKLKSEEKFKPQESAIPVVELVKEEVR